MKLFHTVNSEIITDCQTLFGIDSKCTSHNTNRAICCEIYQYWQLYLRSIQIVNIVSLLSVWRRHYPIAILIIWFLFFALQCSCSYFFVFARMLSLLWWNKEIHKINFMCVSYNNQVCGINMRNATKQHATSVLRQLAGSVSIMIQYNPQSKFIFIFPQ